MTRLLPCIACTVTLWPSTGLLAQDRAPRLIALKDAATLTPVTSVTSGQRLLLTGQAMLTPGVSARVHVAGRYVPGAKWHSESVELVAPAVTTTYRGPVELLWYQGGWQVVATLPGIVTLQPGPPPLPEPFLLPLSGPSIHNVRGGVSERITAPLAGDVIIVTGREFGAVRGRLFWGVVEVAPLSWSETEVRFRMPAGLLNPRGHVVTVRTVGGKYAASTGFIR